RFPRRAPARHTPPAARPAPGHRPAAPRCSRPPRGGTAGSARHDPARRPRRRRRLPDDASARGRPPRRSAVPPARPAARRSAPCSSPAPSPSVRHTGWTRGKKEAAPFGDRLAMLVRIRVTVQLLRCKPGHAEDIARPTAAASLDQGDGTYLDGFVRVEHLPPDGGGT